MMIETQDLHRQLMQREIETLRTKVAELEADAKRYQERIELLKDDIRDKDQYWSDKMNRYGNPYVKEVRMQKGDFSHLIPIIDTCPTEGGLIVLVAAMEESK